MKLSTHKPRKATSQLVTASMIDVVFLLLIFFMTTSNFLRQENEQLVTAEKPEQGAVADVPLEVLKVFVRADPKWRYQIGERKIANREELVQFVDVFGNQENGAIVQPDAKVSFRFTSAAIQVCREAGYSPVTYETPPITAIRREAEPPGSPAAAPSE